MTGAKDPDEFIQARGPDAFRNLIEGSENHVEYRLRAVEEKYDLGDDAQKVAFLKEAAAVVAELQSPVEREVYAMRLAERAGVGKAVVTDEVARTRGRKRAGERKQAGRGALRELQNSVQPRDRALRYENERSAIAEEGVVRLMYLDPSLFDGPEIEISPEDFSSPLLGRVFAVLQEKAAEHSKLSPVALSGMFTPAEESHITAILEKPEILANGKRALADYIAAIRSEQQARTAQDDLRAFAESQRNKKGYGG